MATVLIELIVLLVFCNRYFGGTLLKRIQGTRFDESVYDYEPTVTIVIRCARARRTKI